MDARWNDLVNQRFIKSLGSISSGRFCTFFVVISLFLAWISFLIWGRLLTVSNETPRNRMGLESELQELRKLRVAINKRYEFYREQTNVPAPPSLLDDFIPELHRIARKSGVQVVELVRRNAGEGVSGHDRMQVVTLGTYRDFVHFLGAVQALNSELLVESLVLKRTFSKPTSKQLKAVLELAYTHPRRTVFH